LQQRVYKGLRKISRCKVVAEPLQGRCTIQPFGKVMRNASWHRDPLRLNLVYKKEVGWCLDCNMKRAQKVILGFVVFMILLVGLWTPVCKTLFPERVKANSDKYQAWLASHSATNK
jgi:hypothetical protein